MYIFYFVVFPGRNLSVLHFHFCFIMDTNFLTFPQTWGEHPPPSTLLRPGCRIIDNVLFGQLTDRTAFLQKQVEQHSSKSSMEQRSNRHLFKLQPRQPCWPNLSFFSNLEISPYCQRHFSIRT
jgi:hypothetical protein